MRNNDVVFVAGHQGLVGSALGWRPARGMEEGLRNACADFTAHCCPAEGEQH